jgi:hypothetical protein
LAAVLEVVVVFVQTSPPVGAVVHVCPGVVVVPVEVAAELLVVVVAVLEAVEELVVLAVEEAVLEVVEDVVPVGPVVPVEPPLGAEFWQPRCALSWSASKPSTS